jgi:hypothetical protein
MQTSKSNPSVPVLTADSRNHFPIMAKTTPEYPEVIGQSMQAVHPADASSTLAALSDVSKSNYLPSHTVATPTTMAFNDQTHRACFPHTPGWSLSARNQSFSFQQHPGCLKRHLSEPNLRSATAQSPPPPHPLSHATEAPYRQQWRQLSEAPTTDNSRGSQCGLPDCKQLRLFDNRKQEHLDYCGDHI